MRLATFIADEQEYFGIVITHPITTVDWVFVPHLVQQRILLYASRGTSPMKATHPRFMDYAFPNTMVAFLADGDKGMLNAQYFNDFLIRFLEQSDEYILLDTGWELSEVELQSPIPRPNLFFGLVQNSPTAWRHVPSRTHLNVYPQGHQRPQGSIIGHEHPVILPPIESLVGGWNPELGLIIGKGGKDIPIDQAMSHIAGLTIVSDITINYYREIMFSQPEPYDWFEDAMSSWGDKKSDGRAPVGPFLVTMDEIGNPYDLMIYTRQSGLLRDRSHTGAMNIGLERTVSWLSNFRTLYPGDIIHMGTMGYDGSVFLPDMPFSTDDYVESEIEKVGILRNPVIIADSENDTRPENDITRTIHPVPAIRHLIQNKATQLDKPADWNINQARHFWILFGNDKHDSFIERPYPRFLNTPATALATSPHHIQLPQHFGTISMGVELTCVIKTLASNLTVEQAEDAILGYTMMAVLRDSSFADQIIEPASMQERHLPDVYARWADGFNMVATSLNSLPTEKTTACAANLVIEDVGSIQSNTSNYIQSAPEIIAFISRYITLFPGDVIALGQIGSRLELPKNPSNLSGYAEIEGIARVEFTFS